MQHFFNYFHETSSKSSVHQGDAGLDNGNLGFKPGSVNLKMCKDLVEDRQMFGLKEIAHESFDYRVGQCVLL